MEEVEKLEEIKKKYPDQWILVEVIEENEIGETVKGRVIYHSKARDDVYDAMKETSKYTHVFFSGEIPKKGYAFAF
ncbi:MAG: hypothetical protein R6U61_02085 [Thermoplasmata archaeon]